MNSEQNSNSIFDAWHMFHVLSIETNGGESEIARERDVSNKREKFKY